MIESPIISDLRKLDVLELRSEITWNAHLRLASVLRRSEKETIKWVVRTLNRSQSLSYIHSYTLPFQALVKKEYRRFYLEAAQKGGDSVFMQIRSNSLLNFSAVSSRRITSKARLASDRLVEKIEFNLKSVWARHFSRGPEIDVELLVLYTMKVFDDLIGFR